MTHTEIKEKLLNEMYALQKELEGLWLNDKIDSEILQSMQSIIDLMAENLLVGSS